tara:strand:- start:257 stop:1222 length:966 start_codon:yes stop_codon:yes gene_type:complete
MASPIPNTSYTEIISTTLDAYRGKMADNVLNHSPMLAKLNAKGKVDAASGGAKLLENLMYDENGTFKWYSGYETLSIEGSDVLTSANFDWKQANANVTMSGLEELQNAGKQAVHNLVKSRIMVAEKTMQNNVAASMFYANTESGGKAIGGLQHLVADLPTSGTVGGIDRSTNTWWRNQYYDFSTESITASNSTITAAMNRTYLRCTRGTDSIDLVVAGETYFTYYEESLQAQQRFMSETKAAGGFNAYKYKNADVVYDSNCAATRMYMLNTDYLHFRPHENRNFVTLDRKSSVNQDATVVPIYWAGNLTCSNASLQGVIVA